MEILCTTVICADHYYLKVALTGIDLGECESIRDDAGKYPPRQMPALFTRQVCRTETARQAAENLYEYSSVSTVCHSFLGCCAQTSRCFCPSIASGIIYSPSCQAMCRPAVMGTTYCVSTIYIHKIMRLLKKFKPVKLGGCCG